IRLTEEGHVLAARDREEEPKAQILLSVACAGQHAVDDRRPLPRISPMQEPWKRGGITWAVELGANPFGYAPTTEHDRIGSSWDGDTHHSGVEPAHQDLKLATQIRERRLTVGLNLAVLEHVIETRLLGPRKVERASGIDGYRTSKISGADALRI